MESSPPAQLLACSSNRASVRTFICPSCSLKSMRCRPLLNASIALSSDMSSTEFLSMVHRWMYAHRDSLVPCLQAPSSSSDAGRLYVDLKFLMKHPRNCFQELIDPRDRFFSQCRAELSSMSCMYCIVVMLVPRWNVTVVR